MTRPHWPEAGLQSMGCLGAMAAGSATDKVQEVYLSRLCCLQDALGRELHERMGPRCGHCCPS